MAFTAPQVSFVFTINEIREDESQAPGANGQPHWFPSNSNVDAVGGASGLWWSCDGTRIVPLPGRPEDIMPYRTHSMYYTAGYGFRIMQGDARRPSREATWQPLLFETDAYDWYSSYATNVAANEALCYTRADQTWANVLLPNTYHGPRTTDTHYGGLKGDLTIMLGLIAFSIQQDQLTTWLPHMMSNSVWQAFDLEHTYNITHGRDHKRGLVIKVYTCPTTGLRSRAHDLAAYEKRKFYS